MSDHPTGHDRSGTDATRDDLEELDTETVEDLDAGDEAEDVRGGTTWGCMDGHHR